MTAEIKTQDINSNKISSSSSSLQKLFPKCMTNHLVRKFEEKYWDRTLVSAEYPNGVYINIFGMVDDSSNNEDRKIPISQIEKKEWLQNNKNTAKLFGLNAQDEKEFMVEGGAIKQHNQTEKRKKQPMKEKKPKKRTKKQQADDANKKFSFFKNSHGDDDDGGDDDDEDDVDFIQTKSQHSNIEWSDYYQKLQAQNDGVEDDTVTDLETEEDDDDNDDDEYHNADDDDDNDDNDIKVAEEDFDLQGVSKDAQQEDEEIRDRVTEIDHDEIDKNFLFDEKEDREEEEDDDDEVDSTNGHDGDSEGLEDNEDLNEELNEYSEYSQDEDD